MATHSETPALTRDGRSWSPSYLLDILGDVNRGIHGNPDISSFEGRRIVNPVSHESHHTAVAAQFPDNLLFWAGVTFTKTSTSSTACENSTGDSCES